MDRFIQNYYRGTIDKGEFDRALNYAADQIGVPPDWLSSIFYIETAFSMNPYENRNPLGVGLIQFTDIAIKELINKGYLSKGFTKEDLLKESLSFQMDLIVSYFKMQKKTYGIESLDSVENMYFLVFWPAAVTEQDNYILQTRGLSKFIVASYNPAWDINKDGQITAGEIRENFRKKLPYNITVNRKSPEEEASILKKKSFS